jgi:hypothetical protein
MSISSRQVFAAIRSSKADKHPLEETIDSLERFVGRKKGETKETFCTLSTFNRDMSRERRRGKETHGKGFTELISRVRDSSLIKCGSNRCRILWKLLGGMLTSSALILVACDCNSEMKSREIFGRSVTESPALFDRSIQTIASFG